MYTMLKIGETQYNIKFDMKVLYNVEAWSKKERQCKLADLLNDTQDLEVVMQFLYQSIKSTRPSVTVDALLDEMAEHNVSFTEVFEVFGQALKLAFEGDEEKKK